MRTYILLITFILLGHQRTFAQKNRVSPDQPFEIIIDSTLNQDSFYHVSTCRLVGIRNCDIQYIRRYIDLPQGRILSLSSTALQKKFQAISRIRGGKLAKLLIKKKDKQGIYPPIVSLTFMYEALDSKRKKDK